MASRRKSAAKPKSRSPADAGHKKTSLGKKGRARKRDIVDETSDASFPASDPPSWTSVTGVVG